MNVIVYAIPVFLAIMAAEFGIGLALGRNLYRLNDAIGSLTAGILSQISGVFMLALTRRHLCPRLPFATSLAADDWRVWGSARSSLTISATTGTIASATSAACSGRRMSFITRARLQSLDRAEADELGRASELDLLSADGVAGVPPVVFVVVGLIDLLYQFWIHTELIGKLGWFDRVFASPSNHRVHHGVNDHYLDKNYGGILIVWDRLFGTFVEEAEKPVYGVRGGLGTFDPIWANVSYYATMADSCWRARDWRDKIRVWFAPPGWRPGQSRPPGPSRPSISRRPALRSARRPRGLGARLRRAPRDDRRRRRRFCSPRRNCRSPTALSSSVA